MSEALAYLNTMGLPLSLRQFRSYINSGVVQPIVPGGRGRGKTALFDRATLDEFLGLPRTKGRKKRGLDADTPSVIEDAMAAMVAEIVTQWPYRSKTYLREETVDAGVISRADIERFPIDHAGYIHALITVLILSARNPKHATAWTVLMVLVRRLELSGASIETTAAYLEVDTSTVRIYREKWIRLREPIEAKRRSGDILPGRLVPLSYQEVETITQKPTWTGCLASPVGVALKT